MFIWTDDRVWDVGRGTWDMGGETYAGRRISIAAYRMGAMTEVEVSWVVNLNK